MSLEGAQAGLSWATVLAKRPRYCAVFANFEADQVAQYGEAELANIMADPGVIRNRGKIQSVITNARAIVALEQKGESFSQLLWSFAKTRYAKGAGMGADAPIPSQSPESAAMAQSLRRRGFRFVGATTCYSLMQAAGLVNDHAPDCFRWDEINRSAPTD